MLTRSWRCEWLGLLRVARRGWRRWVGERRAELWEVSYGVRMAAGTAFSVFRATAADGITAALAIIQAADFALRLDAVPRPRGQPVARQLGGRVGVAALPPELVGKEPAGINIALGCGRQLDGVHDGRRLLDGRVGGAHVAGEDGRKGPLSTVTRHVFKGELRVVKMVVGLGLVGLVLLKQRESRVGWFGVRLCRMVVVWVCQSPVVAMVRRRLPLIRPVFGSRT